MGWNVPVRGDRPPSSFLLCDPSAPVGQNGCWTQRPLPAPGAGRRGKVCTALPRSLTCGPHPLLCSRKAGKCHFSPWARGHPCCVKVRPSTSTWLSRKETAGRGPSPLPVPLRTASQGPRGWKGCSPGQAANGGARQGTEGDLGVVTSPQGGKTPSSKLPAPGAEAGVPRLGVWPGAGHLTFGGPDARKPADGSCISDVPDVLSYRPLRGVREFRSQTFSGLARAASARGVPARGNQPRRESGRNG